MMWGIWGSGLFWVVVILAVVVVFWWLRVRRSPAALQMGGDRAVEILRVRCARGDISREEFEARRRDLVS